MCGDVYQINLTNAKIYCLHVILKISYYFFQT